MTDWRNKPITEFPVDEPLRKRFMRLGINTFGDLYDRSDEIPRHLRRANQIRIDRNLDAVQWATGWSKAWVKIKAEAMKSIAIIPLYLAILAACGGCRFWTELFSPKTETKVEAKPTTKSDAGRDSTVWNISFQDVTGKAGYAVPLLIAGWWITKRRGGKAVDTLIEAIETSAPKDETRAVRRAIAKHENCWINKRVACLSKKHGWD